MVMVIIFFQSLTGVKILPSLDSVSDLLRANVPTYTLFFDYFSEGFNFWSWEMGLGTTIFSHADALFDPFTYVTFIAGRDNIPYMIAWSYMVKIALEYVFFYIYLRWFKLDERAILVASISYALCGYSMVMGANLALGTVLVYMPIILLGIEKFLKCRNFSILLIGLLLLGIYSYYYFFVGGIISLFYNLIRDKGDIRHRAYNVVFLGLMGLITLLIVSPIVMPQLDMVLSTARINSGKDVVFSLGLLVPDIQSLLTMFIRSFDLNIMGSINLDFIGHHYEGYGDYFQSEWYVSVIALPLVVYYLYQHRSDKRDLVIVFALLLFLCSIPLVSYLFNATSTINFRWMFIVHIVIAIFMAFSLDEILKNGVQERILVIVTVSIMLLWMAALIAYPLMTGRSALYILSERKSMVIFVLAIMVILYCLLCSDSINKKNFTKPRNEHNVKGSSKKKKGHTKNDDGNKGGHDQKAILRFDRNNIICVGVVILVAAGAVFNYCPWFSGPSSHIYDGNYGYDDDSFEVISGLQESDNGFYRIYKDFDSVYDGNHIPSDNDSMAQSYYGLKCYNSMNNGNYSKFLMEMGVYLACNPDINWLREHGVLPSDLKGQSLNYINGIDDRYDLLGYLGVKYYISKADSGNIIPDHYSFLKSKSGYDIYVNKGANDLGFINSKYILTDDFLKLDFDQRVETIITHTVCDEIPNSDGYRSACKMTSFSKSNIKFDVNISGNEQIVCFSMPYDDDWIVYVDGQKVESQMVNIALLGVTVPGGSHSIELQYQPHMFNNCLIIAILVIIVLVLFAMRERIIAAVNRVIKDEDKPKE